MRECKTFFKKINNCLNHKLKPNSDLLVHLKNCKMCNDFYNSYLDAAAHFKETMNNEISDLADFDFDFIKKEEHSNKNIAIDFRKSFLKPALIAASIIIIFIVSFTTFNLFSKNSNYIALSINNDHLSNFFEESYFDNSNNAELDVYSMEWFNYSDIPEMNFDEMFF